MQFEILPEWLLAFLGVPVEVRRHVSIVLGSGLAVMGFLIAPHVPHVCLLRWLTGIPCPGCGVTHSVIATLSLDFKDAWRWNPAGIVVAIATVSLAALHSAAMLKRSLSYRVLSASRQISRITLTALMMHWILSLI